MPLIDRGSLFATLFVAAVLGVSGELRADAPCEERPRIQIQVEGSSRPALARRTLDLVTAELTARRAPCDVSGEEPAQIVIRWLDESRVRIEVELKISDRAERAGRDVDHGRIPMDGIPAALAIAADELLRAIYEQKEPSSIEPVVSMEVAPERRNEPIAEPPISRSRSSWLGFGLATEIFPGERAFIGPDARASFGLSPSFSVEAHAGLRALTEAVETSQRARLSRLWLLGLDARLRLAKPFASVEIAGLLGADALLFLEASPALVRPALRAGLRASWDASARLRLDAGFDALLLPMSMREASTAEPLASPFGMAPSIGMLVSF